MIVPITRPPIIVGVTATLSCELTTSAKMHAQSGCSNPTTLANEEAITAAAVQRRTKAASPTALSPMMIVMASASRRSAGSSQGCSTLAYDLN
jgi:hypothetical protein